MGRAKRNPSTVMDAASMGFASLYPSYKIYAEIAFAESTWLRSKNFWILPVDVLGMAPRRFRQRLS